MATIADLLIKLGIQDEASAGLQKFGAESEAAGAKAKSFGGVVGETSEGVVKSLGKMAAFMGITGAAFEGAEFVKGGIEAAESLQKSQESLDTAIEKTDGSVAKLGPKFEAVAKSQSDFGISQQDANRGLAESTLMAGGAEKGLRAYQEAVVLSKGAHIGLDAAIRATAKAQEGVTSGLTRYGVVLKPGLSSTKQFAAVMKVWGGQAAANTLDSDRLRAKFENLQASIGAALLPKFIQLADLLARFIDWLQLAAKWVGRNKDVIEPLAAAIGAITAAIVAYKVATAAWTAVTELATAAQEALNGAMDSNPIGLVVLALVGLAAALMVLWHRSETFRNIVTGTWEALKGVVITVVNFIKAHWRAGLVALVAITLGPLAALVALIVTHWNQAKAITVAVWNAIKSAVMTPVNAIKAGVSAVFGALGRIISAAVGGVKAGIAALMGVLHPIIAVFHGIESAAGAAASAIGKVASIAGKIKGGVSGVLSHIPGFATGVTNYRGGLAVVGETGPELVNLPAGSDVFTNAQSRRMLGGHGGGQVIVENLNVADRTDVDLVARELAWRLGA